MDIVLDFLRHTWLLTVDMAPFLLLGFAVAGILHGALPGERLYRHFSGAGVGPLVKASLFGVPLPLCSCGVIPVAAHIRRQGAGRGATVSFLSSTPSTGVDSILATYALLGPLFAIMRPVAAFFGGLISGGLVNVGDRSPDIPGNESAATSPSRPSGLWPRLRGMIKYGLYELPEDTGKWLVIGILAGGLINTAVPADFAREYLGNPLLAYPIMLLAGIPMYICATGSIPIAASFLAAGVAPGAVLVFLFVGPATNTATISFVAGTLGRRTLFLYLTGIVITAVGFGLGLDLAASSATFAGLTTSGAMSMLPPWLMIGSAAALLFVLLLPKAVKLLRRAPAISEEGLVLTIPDMTCKNCAAQVTDALTSIEGTTNVIIDLPGKRVQVIGAVSHDDAVTAITGTGHTVAKQ